MRTHPSARALLSLIAAFFAFPVFVHGQQNTVLGPLDTDSLSQVVSEVTVPSGNPAIGDVISVLTGLEVATAPLGSP